MLEIGFRKQFESVVIKNPLFMKNEELERKKNKWVVGELAETSEWSVCRRIVVTSEQYYLRKPSVPPVPSAYAVARHSFDNVFSVPVTVCI